MTLHVRRADKKDIPRIQELLVQVNQVHADGRPDIFKSGGVKYTDAQLGILLEDDTRPVFVAVNDEELVCGYGFCIITDVQETSNRMPMKTLYIDDLCVDEKIRRMGTGKVLYDYIVKYAREIGCYNLTLNVWACNPSAMAFYEKQGLTMLKKEMETIL